MESNPIALVAFLCTYAYTLCCICLGRCCLGLETRVIIKILKNPCKPINFDMFSWEWSKKNFFSEKKIQNGRLKKTEFFNLVKSWAISAKISWIGPWVSRIDWCKGHWFCSTHVAVRLADISSKTGKKYIFCVFRLFVGQPHDHISWDISMPFASINSTNPRTKP